MESEGETYGCHGHTDSPEGVECVVGVSDDAECTCGIRYFSP